MEPITLCGLVIVAFGFWVEFEPVLMAAVKKIYKGRFFAELISQTRAQKPAYVARRMPICVAKLSH